MIINSFGRGFQNDEEDTFDQYHQLKDEEQKDLDKSNQASSQITPINLNIENLRRSNYEFPSSAISSSAIGKDQEMSGDQNLYRNIDQRKFSKLIPHTQLTMDNLNEFEFVT